LLCLDTACFVVSYFLAGYLWYVVFQGADVARTFQELIVNMGTIAISYILMILFFDLNKRFFIRGMLEELRYVLVSNLLLLAIISMIEYAHHDTTPISRGVSYCTVVLNVVFMYQVHCFVKKYMLEVYRNNKSANQIYLLSTSARVEKTLNEILSGNEWAKRITGIIVIDEDRIGENICGIPVVAGYDNMISFATGQIVDEVFIDVPYDTGESLRDIVLEFEGMGASVHLRLEILNQFQNFYSEFGSMGNVPVVTFSNNIYDYKHLAIKRLMDIAGSLVGLVFTAVVTIFLAPALLMESPGSLIFKQKRVGRNGRFFYMYKFRSMYMDAEERKKELMSQNEMSGYMFKMENDPRITKVGRFIRKTSIDELPQFWNVLKGDMSLVGTRPPTLDEFTQYKSYHKRRLSMRPGITGLWQVSGRNDIDDFEEVVKLDLEYIDHWSLYLDIKIILKTVGAVFSHTGK
jgi:exopolysaccharide biosynthesis polyprenyl glycosylphosphotransferase